MEEKDPFEEYYEETAKPGPGKPAWKRPENADSKSDSAELRAPINIYIKAMNAVIGKTFEAERVKGTRADLVVTLIVGGLAFTMANVFYLLTRHMGMTMTEEEYQATFIGMYKSAIKDIGNKT